MILNIGNLRGKHAALLLLAGNQRVTRHGIKTSFYEFALLESLNRRGPGKWQMANGKCSSVYEQASAPIMSLAVMFISLVYL